MLTSILDAADVRAALARSNTADFERAAAAQGEARGFGVALAKPGLSVIAEIKRRSPSAGDIDADLDPARQAAAYESGGADAISVLTEPEFFGGSLEDLKSVREAVTLPVLRKDFIRNQAQVWESRAWGADALLLIVATLGQVMLEQLVALSRDIGIDTVVEAHTAEEVNRAVALGASIIGVNNRDLATFTTDLAVAETLAPRIPPGTLSIGESGVSSPEGAARMREAGYDAILVGEALVRSFDPSALVAALKSDS
jgi:indole-3-glycerol phosphate synthase